MQNLRRRFAYDVQYFRHRISEDGWSARHFRLRGAISRTDLRPLIAATGHQVLAAID